MKNMQLFLDAFVLALLVLIHLYRPGENLWYHDVTQYKSYFLTFSFIFARFGGFVSAVSLVSVVSFRLFRFGLFVSLFRVLVHASNETSDSRNFYSQNILY